MQVELQEGCRPAGRMKVTSSEQKEHRMQYRRLGRAGLKVSAIGVGANQFGGKVDAKGVANILDAAREAGVNLIDAADVYQGGKSEETIGAAVKDYRDRVLIATKVRHPVEPKGPNDGGTSRHHILQG